MNKYCHKNGLKNPICILKNLPTKFNAHTPWNPSVSLNCMHNTHTHTYIHTTHTAHEQKPEDCNNVPDYCRDENVEPINSKFPL